MIKLSYATKHFDSNNIWRSIGIFIFFISKIYSTGQITLPPLQNGSNGIENGQFNGPKGISIDSSGEGYIIDKGNIRNEVFVPSNNIMRAVNIMSNIIFW